MKKRILNIREPTTITVNKKDKIIFNKLASEYDLPKWELFHRIMKIIKQFKPELECTK